MAAAVILTLSLVYATANYHVQIVSDELVDQGLCDRGLVSVITICHDIDICLDVSEHSPNDIAFSGQINMHDPGSRCS